MTNKELTDFTSGAGYAIALGTRNSELQPAFLRGFGIRLSEDRKALSVFVSRAHAGQSLSNLMENGRAALIVVHLGSLTTRQFKGDFISQADMNEHDLVSLERNLTEFVAICGKFYGEQMSEKFKGMNVFPLISVTFSIVDIFDQTPGPGAGKKIN